MLNYKQVLETYNAESFLTTTSASSILKVLTTTTLPSSTTSQHLLLEATLFTVESLSTSSKTVSAFTTPVYVRTVSQSVSEVVKETNLKHPASNTSLTTTFSSFLFSILFCLIIFLCIFGCVRCCLILITKQNIATHPSPNSPSAPSAPILSNVTPAPSAPLLHNDLKPKPPSAPKKQSNLNGLKKPRDSKRPTADRSRPTSTFSASSYTTAISCDESYKSVFSLKTNLTICKSATFTKK